MLKYLMTIDISNLKLALKTLKESMKILDENRACDFADMLEDSCIKRFEYTLEISRKLVEIIPQFIEDTDIPVRNLDGKINQ